MRPDWDQQCEKAQRLRDEGMSLRGIAAMLRVSNVTVSWMLDPAKRERELQRQRDLRRERQAAKERIDPAVIEEQAREKNAELAARLAEIPEDIRSKTARLMGDPIPNDRRREVWGGCHV